MVGMASDQKFVEYVCDQASAARRVSSRKMFGEYALYYAETVVALICDNRLFVKPTSGGKAMIGTPDEVAPYKGAKPHYLITEKLDDRDWLSSLIAVTARDLDSLKPKKPKALVKSASRSRRKQP
jgi:TfoX/Sxy family transcriptional regulator of competence genes